MSISADLICKFRECTKFNDIYAFTEDMTKKEKGDLFELLTYYLFKLSPFLNTDITNIWLYDDIPDELIKQLNLPTKDKGIDLLFEKNGNFYSIQCKFRQNPDVAVCWGELSTFFGLSFGVANGIKEGYFVTNTIEMCDEITKSNKVKVIDNKFFMEQLPDNFFQNIINLTAGKAIVKLQAKSPLEYQQTCINNVCNYFNYGISDDNLTKDLLEDMLTEGVDEHNRGNIIQACGTGKTLTSYWIDQKLNTKLTLFLVPSLYLLSQFASEIINQSYAEDLKIKLLLIGSDKDVDEETCEKVGGELNLHLEYDDIEEFLLNNQNNKIIIVSTYQSVHKLEEVCCNYAINIDLCIFDEAHKMCGQMGKQFNRLLYDDAIIIWNRLFMTATEKVYNGKIGEEDDEFINIVSMDNGDMFGRRLFEYNTGQAVEDERLTDYCMLSLVCTNKDVELMIKENKLVKYKEEFDEKESHYLATILLILKKTRDGTINHLITYHNTVSRATKFCKFLMEINKLIYKSNDIFVDSFDGSTSMNKRKKIINQFEKSKLGIICSAKVLNEGVNIPITDSVCFVDERNSTIDIQQCCGRAIRLYEGKNLAYIIIPTFIESLDDTELSENGFGNTIRILKAMKNTDEGISDYFMLNDNQKKECKRKIIKFEHVGKVNVSHELEFDKWTSALEGKMSQIVKPKDYDMQCILKVKNWIEQYKRLPTGDTKSKNKKVEKMKDEIIIAKLYNNLKNRYFKMNNELKKEMEAIPGFTLKTNINKDEFYYETRLWLNTFDINALSNYKKILMEIAMYICKNNSFPNDLRHSYGDKLELHKVDSDNFVLLISVLKKEYAINWQEQVKIVKYCKELLKN